MAHYADTSALVKLVTSEQETRALMQWIGRSAPVLVSSDLVRTELFRAVRRVEPSLATRAREVLDSLVLMGVGSAVFDAAGRLDPESLRSLDALHLASALELGDDLEGLLTYDERLADSARLYGIPVLAPH